MAKQILGHKRRGQCETTYLCTQHFFLLRESSFLDLVTGTEVNYFDPTGQNGRKQRIPIHVRGAGSCSLSYDLTVQGHGQVRCSGLRNSVLLPLMPPYSFFKNFGRQHRKRRKNSSFRLRARHTYQVFQNHLKSLKGIPVR